MPARLKCNQTPYAGTTIDLSASFHDGFSVEEAVDAAGGVSPTASGTISGMADVSTIVGSTTLPNLASTGLVTSSSSISGTSFVPSMTASGVADHEYARAYISLLISSDRMSLSNRRDHSVSFALEANRVRLELP